MMSPAPESWSNALEALETRWRELRADPERRPVERLAAIARLEGEVRALEAQAHTWDERNAGHPYAALEAEVEELSRAVLELDAEASHPAIAELSFRAVETRVRIVEQALADAALRPGDSDLVRRLASAIATTLARVAVIAVRCGGTPRSQSATALTARMSAATEKFSAHILSGVVACLPDAPEEAALRLHDATREIVDAAQDLYATIEDYALPEAIAICEAALQSFEPFRAALARAPELPVDIVPRRADPLTRRRPLRDVRRSLDRMARELENERDEKLLAWRLERRLGKRVVTALENSVFVLILVVLVLLLYEVCADPSPATLIWLVSIDTAICVFFLSEFALRLFYAPRKLRYLRRHALVDLLPSIPYGLLVEWLSGATALRILRFLRLARLARYVRVARPLVRIVRAFLFALRGLDRIVRRNAPLLNRALLFASDPPPQAPRQSAFARCSRLMRGLRQFELESLQAASAEERDSWIQARASELSRALAGFDPHRALIRGDATPPRELPVEYAIERLCELDAARVLDALGMTRTKELAAAIGVLRARPVCWLPGPRGLVRGLARNAEPALVVAHVGRRAGQWLSRIHRTLTWFRDLHGTLTGPQLLDKVGTTFVRATARPARRLIGFGGAFVILAGLATLLELELLGRLMRFIARFLGVPILVLGGLALTFFLFGSWLRRVAGSATEYFSTVADAHFLRLLSLVKEHRASEDRAFLHQRAVEPEHKLAQLAGDQLDVSARGRLAARAETLDHMHGDYLRTPPLHPSDVRLSSFLLGNLALQGLLAGTLYLSRRERRALQALDLSKPGFLGPRLWFHFITSAIGQRAARLVVDYNRHCLSIEDLAHATPQQRENFEAWIAARGAGLPIEESELSNLPSLSEESAESTPLLEENRAQRALLARLRTGTWASAHFDALHFLSRDPRREQAVRERFGPQVAACHREDRRRLIHEVFGTHPMTGLTREQLAFNPYRFYWRWFDNGKIILAPLVLSWFVLRFLATGIRRFAQLCREVLAPSLAPDSGQQARCRFDIALRKIHRMRRPLYLTALELRARFDLEYHGIPWPGLPHASVPAGTMEEDLAFIGGAPDRIEVLRHYGEEHSRALTELDAFFAERGQRLAQLSKILREHGAPTWRESGEQVRAATLAYLADEGSIRSLVEGLALERRRDPAHPTRAERKLYRLLARTRAMGDPEQYILRTLVRAAAQSDLWSERLFALRAVQSLAVLDLDVTQDLVWELGDFEALGEERNVLEPRGLRGSRAAHVPSVDTRPAPVCAGNDDAMTDAPAL